MSMSLMESGPRPARWRYHYRNTQRDAVELWISLPRSRPGQRAVELSMPEGSPLHVHVMDVEGGAREVAAGELRAVLGGGEGIVNVLARFRVGPGAAVRLHASYGRSALRLAADEATARRLREKGWSALPPVALPPAERAYYLRSTPLVRVDDATRDEALALARPGRGPEAERGLAAVRRLFVHLASREYRYAWPPPAAGSSAMRSGRVGDCGGYSALLAAWCRALGIPARVVVGSWAMGRMQAHVWTEVFLDGVGWIPADARAAATGEGVPGFARGRHPEVCLGALGGDRMVFSLEMEPHSLPSYEEWPSLPGPVPEGPSTPEPLAWGYRLHAGRVPYLQPAYPRFGGPVRAAGDAALLGSWRFPPSRARLAANAVEGTALAAGVAALLLQQWDAAPVGRDVLAPAGLASFAVFAAVRARESYLSAAVAVALALTLVLTWLR